MSIQRCALCGGEDLFTTGICNACADDGTHRQLLFLRPVNALRRGVLSNRLHNWTGVRSLSSLDEVMKGRQPLARLASSAITAVAGGLAEQGITVRVFPEQEWYRALPVSFVAMILCVLAVGAAAGLQGVTILSLGSPVAALLLMWAASIQLRKPLLSFPRSSALLPATTRSTLADSVVQLPEGRVRSLVLDIARAGEATYGSLPEPFRISGLGESVISLVGEAGSLGLETERLQVIVQSGRAGNAARLHQACEERIRLLEQTLDMLGRIAQHGAESDEAAATEASELLGQVRAESTRRVEAEGEVRALLG